jgi:SAM-dependent methyltransferase
LSNIYSLSDYRQLYTLAAKRIRSEQDYLEFEKFQGLLLARYLESKGISLEGSLLLDIGCGLGGYTNTFLSLGACAYGLDAEFRIPVSFFPKITADALLTPFQNAQFDLIVCASLIEHVADPNVLLNEIIRIVKPGGYIYLSYPPFYSPVGGHQFAPFHLFGERMALTMFQMKQKYKKFDWLKSRLTLAPTSYANAYGTWGLYPLTIARTKKMLRSLPVDLIEYSTRLLPVNVAKVPYLSELITWHVQFLMKKR